MTLDLTGEGVTLVVATKKHARDLARIMRPQDREETLASSGSPMPESVVRASINRSNEAYAAYIGDELICVFGVVVKAQVQFPWMLASTHLDAHGLTFWRSSKIVLKYLREKYPLMMNMIHGKYTEALRWIERLGFTLSPPEPFGPKGSLFCRATLVTMPLTPSLNIDRTAGYKELIHV